MIRIRHNPNISGYSRDLDHTIGLRSRIPPLYDGARIRDDASPMRHAPRFGNGVQNVEIAELQSPQAEIIHPLLLSGFLISISDNRASRYTPKRRSWSRN